MEKENTMVLSDLRTMVDFLEDFFGDEDPMIRIGVNGQLGCLTTYKFNAQRNEVKLVDDATFEIEKKEEEQNESYASD